MKKRIKMMVFIMLMVFIMIGCATSGHLSSIQAGKVLVVNRNEGAWANCFLFRGAWLQNDLITINYEDGSPKFTMLPLSSFEISSTYTRDINKVKMLLLSPNTSYTLFIIWTRFTGQVLDMDTVHFRTSDNPFRDNHIDPLGRKIYADRIVFLPKVNTSSATQIRIKKTIHLDDWFKALMGF
ncbi:MAG: hypothetical protein V1829_01160 [bacterium]